MPFLDSFWDSVIEWVSSHKLEAADMLNRFLLLFIIYLYGIKAKPKPTVISITRILFTKGKKRGRDDMKAHKRHIHLMYLHIQHTSNKFITFSGLFISFEDRKSFGTEITKHLKVQQFISNSLIWGKSADD